MAINSEIAFIAILFLMCNYFMPDQFSNAANYMAHYQRTALEIWRQTDAKVDYVVSALGTSGTIMGLSRFMRALNPEVKIVSAHPIKGHYIQGSMHAEQTETGFNTSLSF